MTDASVSTIDVYIGDQPIAAVAEVESVNEEFMAEHLRAGDWVSVRVDGIRILIDRRDLMAA